MDKKRIRIGSFSLIALLSLAGLAVAFSNPPEVGKPAPQFTLKSNEGKTVNLKDYHGKWVVLYFYPKDFTSGCTIEAHNFQRDMDKYEQAKANLAVSQNQASYATLNASEDGVVTTVNAEPGQVT